MNTATGGRRAWPAVGTLTVAAAWLALALAADGPKPRPLPAPQSREFTGLRWTGEPSRYKGSGSDMHWWTWADDGSVLLIDDDGANFGGPWSFSHLLRVTGTPPDHKVTSLSRFEKLGIKVTVVFAGFEGESYVDIPTVERTIGLVPVETRAERVADRLVGRSEIDHRDAFTIAARRGARDSSDQEEAGSCSKNLLRAHTSRARRPSNCRPVALSSDQRTVAPTSTGSALVGIEKLICTRTPIE